MAQTLINNSNTESNNNNRGDGLSPFRKIEFNPARKPFTGFTNSGYSDFRLETLNPPTSSISQQQRLGSNQTGGRSGLIGKKRDGSEFLESGFDPELSFGITFRRIGAGLDNLGNTCFLNSVLQCLTYTEPLAAYLQSGKHQSSCRNAGFCALCAIQKHVSRALQSTGRSLAPKDLVSNLQCISRTFRNSRQEDAHEYMVNLLESMHKCCLPSGVPSESPSAYEKSLVHKIFGGRLRSQVKCMQCSFCSNKFDPFLDLSLEIVTAESLYKAFANFTAKEQLDGGEKQYQCQQCKQKVRALKQLTIHKAPYVLTVHLKRFDSHISGQKIDKKVQFGPTLDLKPFVTGPYDGDLKYTLYGVLVHAGWSTHSGHYYCFVRTSSGMWYSLDDNQVVQVSEKKVFKQKAYMLFYFRDRKNIPLKKPVDIVQKENIVINDMGRNNTYANINEQMIETVQRSTIENKLNGSNPSPTFLLRDTSSASASKDTIMKEKTVQESSCLTRCSARCRESHLEGPPKGQQQNDLVKVPSILQQTGEPCLPQSDSPVEGINDTIKLNDAINMPPAAKIVQCSVGSSTNKDLDNFATIPSNCNGVQNSVTMKDRNESVSKLPSYKENRSTNGDLSDSTSVPTNYSMPPSNPADTTCNTEKTCSGEKGNIASSPDSKKTTMEKIDAVMPVSQTNGEDTPIEDVSKAVAGGESPGGIASNDGQKTEATVSTELNNSPKLRSSLLQEKVLDHKRYKKLQKKFLNCQVISMNLGSNILIRSSLGLWKKKKHKRSKKCALRVKNLTPEELMDGIQIDQGTSSSEKVKEMTLCGGKKNKRSSRSEDRTGVIESVGTSSSGDMAVNPVDKELKDRVDKHGAVLATSGQLGKYCNSIIAGSQSDSKGRNGRSQSELVKMLIRGLLETNVPHWDDKEPSPFQITESRGVEKISIGYVADEWDEEYDRGKRKKVRNPMDRFDGQNPFQEFATKKAKLNKSKLNQSSSGNRPFRI